MDGEQCFLIPFYEYMKTIIGVTALPLKIGNCNDKHIDFKGNFITEFTLNFDNNTLLTESRKSNSNKFDVRLVMRFCKKEDKILEKKQISMVDCFPQNLKIDINSQPVKLSSYLPYDRFRKPGRMNPRLLDITNLILEHHICTHTCNINWVQDDGEEHFNFALYLVRRRSFEELSTALKDYRIFSVQNTINLLSERTIIHPVNNNSNIEYMFQDRKVLNASLVCPLSLSRMKIPVRGGNCTHLKCFDLMSFLIINFQKPTWTCPICDKKAFFCHLKIDGLIYSIINDERSNLMDEIKFNEHGQWKSSDEDSSENSDTDSFYDIPGVYYELEINNEQCNGGTNLKDLSGHQVISKICKEIKECAAVVSSTTADTQSSTPKEIKCSKCNKIFKSETGYKCHKATSLKCKTITISKEIKGDICNRTFTKQQHLADHNKGKNLCEKENEVKNIQRSSEIISRMDLNKDAKNILPMSDWMSLKNKYCCSNNTNMVASLVNNTISNVNSKILSTQNVAIKKSTISNSSGSNNTNMVTSLVNNTISNVNSKILSTQNIAIKKSTISNSSGSNDTNIVTSLANNTISNVNSKSLSTQNIAIKKSTISNSSQSNITNSKTLVFQETSHQTNLISNSTNNSNNNLKRTHVHSSSESLNEKELPVKKPTLDSRCIPKVNGSKTVTASVHNDQPNNTDSEMANNLITNYNQPRSRSGIIIQVINKDKYVYGQIESQLVKEIRQCHNYWFYETTNIPNNFKFFDAPKRKIYITTIISCDKVNLFDIFPDMQRESITSNMWIHSINKPFNIFISRAPTPIYLEKHTTLEITNGDGREKQITFQSYNNTTIIMIEILYLIKPSIIISSNEPSWTYNVNLNDFQCMKSFIRLQLSQQQEDKLTYFVATHYATLRETLHPAVVAVTVLNFEGELIMNSIITPRNPIKHFQSHVHGLKEEQIRNNWDSEDFKAEIRKVLDGRILVGLVVKDFLEAVDFPLSRVLGIRDLSNARCFEKLNLLKCKGAFRIKYLEKLFIPNEKSVKVYLQTENYARSIRKIYIKLRDQWEDHIFPEEQCETLFSVVNKSKAPNEETANTQKIIKMMSKENELNPPPMITMQDKKDLMTNNEKGHILQKNEDSKVVQSKISILPRNNNTNAADSEISIISVTKSNLEITPDMEIKKERSKKTVLEEQMRKRKGLLQPVKGEDDCFTISGFNDLDFQDPIYWKQPESNWKPHITHYMGKEVKQTFISNQEKVRNRIVYNGASHPLSSLVYVNDLTGEPLVVTYRYGAKAVCGNDDKKSISNSPGHSSKC